MGIQRNSIVIALLIFLLPSAVFAEEVNKLKNGYDLYHNIKLMDNPQSPDDVFAAMHAVGYMNGFLDGLVITQTLLYETTFLSKFLSEKEQKQYSKEMNFHRINIPEGGLATGQLMLIYKKYEEGHPEKLNGSARACVFESLVEAYGWK